MYLFHTMSEPTEEDFLPDVYEPEPSTDPPVLAGQVRQAWQREAREDARVDQFVTDAKRSLDALDADLSHGNVLAAREDALSLRIQLSLLVKALRP